MKYKLNKLQKIKKRIYIQKMWYCRVCTQRQLTSTIGIVLSLTNNGTLLVRTCLSILLDDFRDFCIDRDLCIIRSLALSPSPFPSPSPSPSPFPSPLPLPSPSLLPAYF
jgi:hypothetical protein